MSAPPAGCGNLRAALPRAVAARTGAARDAAGRGGGGPEREELEAVLLGGSAGSLEVLAELLPALGEGTPPVVVVVHIPRSNRSLLAQVLAARCPVPVREPLDKEPLERGTVYVAPAGYHLLLEPGPAFALSLDAPVRFSQPSIDVLLESAAQALGPRVMAVVLSGANEDGADGLAAVCRAGGLGIVQSPATAMMATMPLAAVAKCREARVLAPVEIARVLAALAPARQGSRSR